MTRLLTDALAVARLARLATRDTLPPLAALRDRVEAAVRERHGDEWATGVTCAWCVSVYAGLAAVAARRLAPRLWDPLARVLAFSEVAGLLAEWEDR